MGPASAGEQGTADGGGRGDGPTPGASAGATASGSASTSTSPGTGTGTGTGTSMRGEVRTDLWTLGNDGRVFTIVPAWTAPEARLPPVSVVRFAS